MQEKSKYKKFNESVERVQLTVGAEYQTPTGERVVVRGMLGKKWQACDAARPSPGAGAFWPSELQRV